MVNDGLRQRQQVLSAPPAREAFRHAHKKDQNNNSEYYEWIVPFIPPVLRVNRDTRVKAYSYIKNNFHLDALRKMTCFFWSYKLCCVKILTFGFLWLRLLSWIHENAAEFANAFVIFSGLALIVYNCNSAVDGPESGNKPLSAYSIFNPNVERVLGSLTAEQFENEIRHRPPESEHENLNENEFMALGDYEDPELMRAIEMSLREAERQRDFNKTIREDNE